LRVPPAWTTDGGTRVGGGRSYLRTLNDCFIVAAELDPA
jgi:hypothetical protein